MDAVSNENRHLVVSRILEAWGLDAPQKAQILDDKDKVIAVLSIHESLQSIYSESPESALKWPLRPNREFSGCPPIDAILAGDIQRVQQYLKYHVYNA